MNKSCILSAFIFSSHAMAATVPSTLPDGKYSSECQMITVEKYDPAPSGSTESSIAKNADANGIVRLVENESGTATYITSGDLTTIKQVYSVQGESALQGEDLIQKTIKAVGENQFEEVGTVTSSLTLPANKDSKSHKTSQIHNWKRTFAVQGNFEINLKSKNGDDPEIPGRSEVVVTKNSDGSYDVISYAREGFHREAKKLDGGVQTQGRFIYQASSICRYTPTK